MNNLKVKLIKQILQQVPLNSRLYMGDYVSFMFDDGFMMNLCQYETTLEPSRVSWYYKCYIISRDFISYFLRELENSVALVNYFSNYMITFDDEILLCVYDRDIFSIKSTLLTDDELIEDCTNAEIDIIFEDKVTI